MLAILSFQEIILTMSEQPKGIHPFELLGEHGISEMFFPTPKERREDATEEALKVGDLVECLVGPAIGKIGLVIIDRNGNYVDYQDHAGIDSIGVQVVERMNQGNPAVQALLQSGLVSPDARFESATRWFDDPEQLSLVYREQAE